MFSNSRTSPVSRKIIVQDSAAKERASRGEVQGEAESHQWSSNAGCWECHCKSWSSQEEKATRQNPTDLHHSTTLDSGRNLMKLMKHWSKWKPQKKKEKQSRLSWSTDRKLSANKDPRSCSHSPRFNRATTRISRFILSYPFFNYPRWSMIRERISCGFNSKGILFLKKQKVPNALILLMLDSFFTLSSFHE